MDQVHKLRSDYWGRAIVMVVYIREAHAKDEWPYGPTISYCDQPKALKERCLLAQRYVDECNSQITMLVDTMENLFDNQFAAWPFRFYIIENGILRMRAEPDKNFMYNITHIRKYLQENGY